MRNSTARRTTCQQIDDIDALLEDLRKYKVVLTYGKNGRVVIWAPNTCVPMRIRQAVAAHNRELRHLLGLSDPRTCPTPDLHSWSWDYKVCRECCDVCAHLKPFIESRTA